MRHQYHLNIHTDRGSITLVVVEQPYGDAGEKGVPFIISQETFTGPGRIEEASARARTLAQVLVAKQVVSDQDDREAGSRP